MQMPFANNMMGEARKEGCAPIRGYQRYEGPDGKVLLVPPDQSSSPLAWLADTTRAWTRVTLDKHRTNLPIFPDHVVVADIHVPI
jgi:hypothetical protein